AAGSGPRPVVVAVMGGAWTIGHRLWNVLLAARLAEAGAMVVAVDYRNSEYNFVWSILTDLRTACLLDSPALESAGIPSEVPRGRMANAGLLFCVCCDESRQPPPVDIYIEGAQSYDNGGSDDAQVKVLRHLPDVYAQQNLE
ncbi:putative isoprenylcysteine alpha-carbonyl methylesterase ICME, partial [Symbiodinium microadriaticum]